MTHSYSVPHRGASDRFVPPPSAIAVACAGMSISGTTVTWCSAATASIAAMSCWLYRAAGSVGAMPA
ncbi:hypothetical protein GCM10023148_39460 [Actinokineospora soli]